MIYIQKSKIPLIFVDTFAWKILLKDHMLKNLLKKCINEKKLIIPITSFQEIELKNRGYLDEIKNICGDSYTTIPTGHISANQILTSLISYFHDSDKIELKWELCTSNVPILNPPRQNLKEIFKNFSKKLNKARESLIKYKKDKNLFISYIAKTEAELTPNLLIKINITLSLTVHTFAIYHFLF